MKQALFALFLTLLAVNTVTAQKYNKPSPNKEKIGIVLSGGAARGFAHLGVLQALEDNGIFADYVAGSSMGALLGSIYASGVSPMEIYNFGRKQNYIRLYRPSLKSGGLLRSTFLAKMLDAMVPQHNNFDSLEKKMHVCMSNLNKAEWEIASTGTFKDKVIASTSIPFIFHPAIIDSFTYVDGGLLNNLPVEPLLEIIDCKHIIGVSVNPLRDKKQSELSGMNALMRTVSIIVIGTELKRREKCHYYIEVEKAHDFGLMEFNRIEELYEVGYKAAMEYINENPEILKIGIANQRNIDINEL
ncbi:MAG: patatin-like phospholipase family protein [Prevotellaceae bacterium]|jgi:NTE family protein|nr:patatin-like phospholipase family protein [Prevotellaceae bacterium]